METSRPDISLGLYAKLLAHQPTSASVERSFSMLKSMIHENRNFTDAHVAFYWKIVFNGSISYLLQDVHLNFFPDFQVNSSFL